MKTNFLLTLILFSAGIGLKAQSIACGIWADSTQQFNFCRVNAATGQTIFSNPIPGMTSAFFYTSMVDIANNQYILKVSDPNDRYYAIDITTGSVVTDVAAPDPISMLEIHPVTGVAYGLFSDNSFVIHFVSVDVHTGVMTDISTLPGSITNVNVETSVLNPLTNQYIFVGDNYTQYYTVDITTGAIVNTTLAYSEVVCLRIHPTTGIIYGLWYEANLIWRFVSVDNLTGQHTVINTPPGINTITLPEVFLDPVNNQYTYRFNTPQRYYSLDLATGTLVNDTAAVQDVYFLEWCGISTGIEENEDLISSHIAPNPFSDYTVIKVDNPHSALLTISVSDMRGREILTREEEGMQQIVLDRNQLGLKSGMYLVVISKDDMPLSQSKIIVQ